MQPYRASVEVDELPKGSKTLLGKIRTWYRCKLINRLGTYQSRHFYHHQLEKDDLNCMHLFSREECTDVAIYCKRCKHGFYIFNDGSFHLCDNKSIKKVSS